MPARGSVRRGLGACALLAVLGWSFLSLIEGCGIDVIGSLPGGEPDGGAPDGAVVPSEGGAADGADGAASCATTCADVPADWRVIALADGTLAPDAGAVIDASVSADVDAGFASCPAGTQPAGALSVNPRASGVDCACSCGALPSNPCAQGTLRTSFRTGVSSCNDGVADLPLDGGGCEPRGFNWNNNYNGAGGTAQPVASIACPASAAPTPVIDDGAFVECAPAAPGGCEPGKACVPAGLAVCVARDGAHPCPPGYPTARPLSRAVDNRVCDACSCTSAATACNNERLDFYTNATCTGASRGVAVDGFCNSLGGSGTPTHYRYSADPDTKACAAAAATVGLTGAVDVTTVTVCCP